MSISDDKNSLPNADAKRIWIELQARYDKHHPALDAKLDQDLGIDSLEWLNVVLEIESKYGIRLDPGAVGQSKTFREILGKPISPSQHERLWTVAESLIKPDDVIGDDAAFWLSPLSTLELAAAKGIHTANWLIFRSYFGMRVQGRQNLPTHGPFIIAPHHVSYLDAFAVAAALDFALLRRAYWAAWTGFAFGATSRVLRRLTHVVPIDRPSGAALNLAYGAAVLQRGHSLIWFPEGAISHSGDVMPLRPGLGALLETYPIPVVPVVVQGTRQALPPGHRVAQPKRVTVNFGKALSPQELERKGTGGNARERILDALREEMSRICDLRKP
jgi:long-chain acyl-CoA synthetase